MKINRDIPQHSIRNQIKWAIAAWEKGFNKKASDEVIANITADITGTRFAGYMTGSHQIK